MTNAEPKPNDAARRTGRCRNGLGSMKLELNEKLVRRTITWVNDFESMSGAGWASQYRSEAGLLRAWRKAAQEALDAE